jgi:hypothetical protein
MLKHVIVSAAASDLGKTTVCCALLERVTRAGMTALCCKLSRGGHGPAGIFEGPGREGSDTWRFDRAGAARAALVRFSGLDELESLLPGLIGHEDVAVWESNALASCLDADCLVYIRGGGAGPKSPGLAARADLLLDGPLGEEAAREAAAGIMEILGRAGGQPRTEPEHHG